MKYPKIPENEEARLSALRSYNILDTHTEQSFDDLTILAAKICNTPIALISLVDEKRQWFKSHYGIDASETPRDYSFCAHAINDNAIFEVEDSTKDERFKDNPLVTSGPQVRFYAGAPLQTPGGLNIGTLCVIDQGPRSLNAEQRVALQALARQVIFLLELAQKQESLLIANREMKAVRRSYSIVEFDLNGTILTANENFLKLFGYTSEELIGKHHSIFIPYCLRKSEEYLKFWKDLRGGIFNSNEFKRITKDETEVWIRGSYNPVYDEKGQIVKIIKTALDITEEKYTSVDAQQKLSALSVSNAVVEFDLLGNIIYINDNFIKITGYTKDEVLGKHHSIFINEETKKSNYYREFWEKLQKGIHQSGEFERKTKNGKPFFIRGTYNPILDLNDTPYKIVKYALDVTDERIKSANDGEILNAIDRSTSFVEFDLQGNILTVNDSFLKLMKYARSEVVGKHHSIFLHEKDFNQVDYHHFWEQLNLGIFQSGEFLRINKFGKEVWIRGHYNPIFDIHGKPYKILKYAIDITESKVATKIAEQRQLELIEKEKNLTAANASLQEAKERAIIADQIKTNFLYTVSHEIRTPLNGILGMTSLLQETQLTSEQQEFSDTIFHSGKTLLTIINDILDFSKIEAGKMDIEESEFNFPVYFKELLKPFQYAAKKKDIFLNMHCDNYTHTVYGDNGRLGQIISNLVSNSIKFTKLGGVEVHLSLTPNDNVTLCKITVRDTGLGIPDDAKPHMFQPFTQAEKSTARKFGGTGLGLSISKRLVEMMGGKIYFESEYEKGTTFTVEIKLKTGTKIEHTMIAQNENIVSFPANAQIIVGRILVAEDNATNQLVIARMLDKWGCKYHIVANGDEVLSAMKESHFDLILMDCQMPHTDGYTATQNIRTNTQLNYKIPIIALTANCVNGDAEKCHAAGMDEYLTKPIDKNALERMLKKYLKTQPHT